MYASVFLEQPNRVGRYYKDLTPLIGKEIFSPHHEVHSYYTAAYIAYRLEFMFRDRRMGTEWKPFRFQLAMAARLILERDLELDPKRKRSQAYGNSIDAIMLDPETAQAVFEEATEAIGQAIAEMKDQGAELDRRTAKMRDMKDKLRAVIAGQAADLIAVAVSDVRGNPMSVKYPTLVRSSRVRPGACWTSTIRSRVAPCAGCSWPRA